MGLLFNLVWLTLTAFKVLILNKNALLKWILTKHILLIISQYMYVNSLCCTP